jgi:hypothetical protein
MFPKGPKAHVLKAWSTMQPYLELGLLRSDWIIRTLMIISGLIHWWVYNWWATRRWWKHRRWNLAEGNGSFGACLWVLHFVPSRSLSVWLSVCLSLSLSLSKVSNYITLLCLKLSAMMFLLQHRPTNNVAKWPWTTTSETMDQNESFFLKIDFLGYFVTMIERELTQKIGNQSRILLIPEMPSRYLFHCFYTKYSTSF